eukprot:7765759-Pyramimonas_sp.AAC.1
MEGVPFSKSSSHLSAAHFRLHKSQELHGSSAARVSHIEGGACSKCGSHLNAAHIRLKHVQELH